MRFAKLHGLGNDFVLVDRRGTTARALVLGGSAAELERVDFARRVCDRHFGVGADGILALYDPEPGEREARLVIHNPDGSRPEMCGNGIRCAALWMVTRGCTEPASGEAVLLTEAGLRRCAVRADSATRGSIEVGMGAPRIDPAREALLHGGRRELIPVSMGNPHRVFFLEQTAGADDARATGQLRALCAEAGPALCRTEDANIEFVYSLGHQRFRAAVWERGAGATLACGTGACAVAAAAISKDLAKADQPISVELPGGLLELQLRGSEMMMRGPAELVFRGDL